MYIVIFIRLLADPVRALKDRTAGPSKRWRKKRIRVSDFHVLFSFVLVPLYIRDYVWLWMGTVWPYNDTAKLWVQQVVIPPFAKFLEGDARDAGGFYEHLSGLGNMLLTKAWWRNTHTYCPWPAFGTHKEIWCAVSRIYCYVVLCCCFVLPWTSSLSFIRSWG